MLISVLYAGIVSIRTSRFHREGARKVGLPAPMETDRQTEKLELYPNHFYGWDIFI